MQDYYRFSACLDVDACRLVECVCQTEATLEASTQAITLVKNPGNEHLLGQGCKAKRVF